MRHLFKQVYLHPQGRHYENPSNYPSDLPVACSLCVKTLICQPRQSTDQALDHCRVFRAISLFQNLRYLSVRDGPLGTSGVRLVLQQLGALPVLYPKLKFLKLESVPLHILGSQHDTLAHLCLRSIHPYPTSPLQLPFPNLQFLTLDSRSVIALSTCQEPPSFYWTVKNVRIIWDYRDLNYICTSLAHLSYPSSLLTVMIKGQRSASMEKFLNFRGIEHLHMDALAEDKNPWKSFLPDVLSSLISLSTYMASDLKELVIWIPELSVNMIKPLSMIANSLPLTFFGTSAFPHLEGLVAFLELPTWWAATEIQEALTIQKSHLSTVLLEHPPTTYHLFKAPLLINEGKMFGCQCHFIGQTCPAYITNYFGMYLIMLGMN